MGHWERVLQAGDTTGKGFCSGLPRGKGTRGQTGRHTAGSFPPTLHQGGASATPSHFSQVTAWRLCTHCSHILPRDKQGPSHLLSVAGLPSRLSGRSMGHPPRSAAAGDANSLPLSLGRTENGPAAWRAPGRTSRGMTSSDQPPQVGDPPVPQAALGSQNLFAHPCLHHSSSGSDLLNGLAVWAGKGGLEE